MIAVDTNLLVYAHRADALWHIRADNILTELSESNLPWAIPWPCLYEFLAIVTHSRIFRPPTPLENALIQIECWLEAPTLRLLQENDEGWRSIESVIERSQVTGTFIHDARIVSLCLQHGVKTLWSADRDLSRFSGIKIENPLLVPHKKEEFRKVCRLTS